MAQLALRTVIERLFPSSLLGWAMEVSRLHLIALCTHVFAQANFLYMAFCAGFLLNVQSSVGFTSNNSDASFSSSDQNSCLYWRHSNRPRS